MKEFTADGGVSFGDVLLKEDRIIQGPDGGEMKPGRGGVARICLSACLQFASLRRPCRCARF